LLDEVCFERLVDDLNSLSFTVTGKNDKGVTKTKSFTIHSFPGNEFADEEVPTVVVAIYDHSPGYGGISNLASVDEFNVHNFSRAFTASVELRMHAREYKKGAVMFHPRDITKAMFDKVVKRVQASWDRILIDYYGSVSDATLDETRDYQEFVQGTTESMRLLRFQIKYERHWTKMLDGETAEDGSILTIEFGASDVDASEDEPTTVMND